MPHRLIWSVFTGPFSSQVSTGRTLWILGEVSLITLTVLATYQGKQPFSPIEFSAAYAAILAAGGFGVKQADEPKAAAYMREGNGS